jgi:DNA (cytosine-5)-methyltransferase 1
MASEKWDVSVEVESNTYNWDGAPQVVESAKHQDLTKLGQIDLFSGCGGFSTGFEMAGFETAMALDIHPPSLETLRLNHPSAHSILGDIRKVNEGCLESLVSRGRPGLVVTAGVPCQGFSLSNRKRHSEDKRNYLFLEFIRIAEYLQPDVVVLENVSGLVSTNDGSFKRDIASAIEELGYDVHFALLNAADYGVPQTRKRVFFVGVPRGSEWLFPESEYGISGRPYQTVRQALLGDLPRLEAGSFSHEYSGPPTSELQTWLRMNHGEILYNHLAPAHPRETIDRIRNTKPGEPMYPAFKQRIRLHPDSPSPTQICGGIRPQFQFGHPTQARGLTIRERARIQTFPDTYRFSGGVTQGRVQTGNAVPPLLAKVLADQIVRLMKGQQLNGIQPEHLHRTLF